MIEYIDDRKYERIYGISRSAGGLRLLLLYILLAWILLSVTALAAILIFNTQIMGYWGISPSIIQLASVLGTIALIPVGMQMYMIGSEEISYQIRDYMWGSKLRPFIMPLRGIVLSIAALVITYLPLFAFTLLVYIVLYFVIAVNSLKFPPYNSLWVISLSIVITIFGLVYLLSYRKRSRIQKRVVEDALTALRFRHGVTAYIPGFVGLDNGDIYVEESIIFLKARSRSISAILRHRDYLLVNDSKGDVFMWRGRGSSWIYMGHLQWEGEDVRFSTEKGPRYGFSRLWIFGEQLRFKALDNYYFTDTFGERMRVRRFYQHSLADMAVKDGVYYLRRDEGIPRNFYVELQGEIEGKIIVGEAAGTTVTRRLYCNGELWVNLGARLYRYSLPVGEEVTYYKLPGDELISYNPIRTSSFPGLAYSLQRGVKTHMYLLTDPASGMHYRLRNYTESIYYLDESSVHVSYQNVYYRLPLSGLEQLSR